MPSSRPLPSRPPMRRALAALAVAGAVVLTSACTGDDEPTPAATSDLASPAGGGAGEEQAPPVDDVAEQVLAEQTVDTPAGGEVAGGQVTLILRDVRVDAEVLSLRWALRWEAPERGEDEEMTLFDLGIEPTPVVTDTTHLQAFMPLCVKGDWNGGTLDRQECRASMLASPVNVLSTRMRNGSTLEGWAALPAPDTEGGSLDVLIAEGLPAFTGVTARTGS
ncbi:conserved hypothetical protein [Cellulomonas flavigena DSM 20109]|uniref:Lipoprotein n=1 Tax=Cellulomonas flavigena (strain ATCC 482 / DSM 20109 / BCRC 11376 / JCM 18109 / NBRC 3775 / NCIMB 8073 / NRS 134) TaxID=446466 RepID=D5UKK0_CELFN|nr:hypothetical protein [Cellulomonas flavigena]ADG75861.1 conserved hypothetical protein [Cellulomonas flavigena DSM 20109]